MFLRCVSNNIWRVTRKTPFDSSIAATFGGGSTATNYWNRRIIFFRGFSDDVSSESPSNLADAGSSSTLDEKKKKKGGISEKAAAEDTLPTFSPAPSFFSGAPVKMARAHVDKDKRSHRQGVGEVGEGTAGEKIFEFVDAKSIRYPTIETLKEPFGGIPYAELPEVRIFLSKNNTKVSVVDYRGTELFRTSASIEGFKNCKKKTEVAGQTVGVSAGNKCVRRGLSHVRVLLSGLGPGRQSCVLGMSMTGVKIVSMTDFTPLPELGPRPRKARRL